MAPPGLGRLVSIVTPVGDMNGIDETAPGIVSHFWADDPECSSTSSSYPSSFFRRGACPAAPPAPLPPSPPAAMHLLETPLPILMQIAPYAAPATGTASSGSRAISSAKLDRLMESLRHSREAEALAKQAAEAAKAIKAEHHELRLGLHAYRQAHGLAGPSMQQKGRRRKPQTPSRKHMTEAENAHRDNGPDAGWVILHERHAEAVWRCTTYGHTAGAVAAPSHLAEPPQWDFDDTDGTRHFVLVPTTTMAKALEGDDDGKQAAWAKASSAISQAVTALVPPALGRNKKGGVLITVKMRDLANRTRAACQLVSALSLQTCSAILQVNLIKMAARLHDEELYSTECANELTTFFARWGTSTLKGALSTLTRLRAFAEARGEYEAADSDTYPAQLSSAFLDSINASAVKAAAERQAKAEAEGKTLTVQQQRRDGRSAAKTAFRSLRFLLDNAKMVTAARDALVFKRKFATTVPAPTPSLEPPHYAHLCYLAAHHADRVVRGTAAGFALTASQTSRFKQAQSCAILAEKKGVLYTAVQMDKSNEPHKQSARPAFGPIFDAFGTRGVIDAVYDALTDVEAGCFLVRDNDSISGAPVDGSSFTNGPILGARADAALQYLLTLPPLKCDPTTVLGFKVHSLKPMMLKHAARMTIGPIERHGLGRFSGSAAQNAALVPEPAELKRHKLRCSQLPDRYAQDSAFAADARTAVQVSKDIQRLVRDHSIEALAAMEWADGPDHDGEDTPDAAPEAAQAAPIAFTLRERMELTRGLAESGLLDGVDGDYGD